MPSRPPDQETLNCPASLGTPELLVAFEVSKKGVAIQTLYDLLKELFLPISHRKAA